MTTIHDHGARSLVSSLRTGSKVATVAAGAFTAAFIGLAAPVAAAPAGPANAERAIAELRSQGYRVVVDRIDDVPLDKARIVSVRPNVSIRPGAVRTNDGPNETFAQTIYVEVK
ncbi:hypothetical protein H7I41_13285 [Mycobacterium manitobense]|uniref:Uncharacterized protein n=1 Tax=[Mycobacterium] manitobense TaxID=190147 RepID=A0A9X2YMJ1_9MYCO|nr:hypothetical protein [[Mycobacterium] manitobense]MCV7170885.1 hypothetical protein [[Mycobacterium] manitobense]